MRKEWAERLISEVAAELGISTPRLVLVTSMPEVLPLAAHVQPSNGTLEDLKQLSEWAGEPVTYETADFILLERSALRLPKRFLAHVLVHEVRHSWQYRNGCADRPLEALYFPELYPLQWVEADANRYARWWVGGRRGSYTAPPKCGFLTGEETAAKMDYRSALLAIALHCFLKGEWTMGKVFWMERTVLMD